MRMIRFFIRSVDRANEIIAKAVSIMLVAMVATLAVEVFARYLLKRPTIWAYDMAIFMFGYCGLLAGAYVLKMNEHINVDLFYSKFSPRVRAIVESFTSLLFFFFILLVTFYGWESAWVAIQSGDRRPTEWGPPLGHYRLMIPLAGFLLFLQGLANWIRNIYLAITGKRMTI